MKTRAATPQRLSTKFYSRLESLRGLAALSVAGFHCFQSKWLDSTGIAHEGLANWPTKPGEHWDTAGRIWAGLWNGEGAVIVFFVISGFVLTGSLARSSRVGPATVDFTLARLFRIYPAAVLAIALFACAFWTSGAAIGDVTAYQPPGLLCNALVICADINGVMWTLRVELLAVPLLLVTFFGWRKWGLIVPATALATLTVLLFTKFWSDAFPFGKHIVAFMPGVLVFLFGHKLFSRLSSKAAAALLSLVTGLYVLGVPLVGFWNPWTIVTVMSLGAIMVGLMAFAPLGAVGRFLDYPLIRFLGRISYSFYLLHPLTLLVMWNQPQKLGNLIGAGMQPAILGCVLFFVSTAIVIPVAWCSYTFVERPGVLAGRRLVKTYAADWKLQ